MEVIKILICRCFNKLEHAEEFLNGRIRMMSLEYYRNMEADEHGRKDKYEGAEKLWQGEHTIVTIDGHEITGADGLVSVVLSTDANLKNTKICCCTMLPISDKIEGVGNLKKFHLPYTIIFTNPNEFVSRFRKAANGKNYATGRVSFFDDKKHNGDLNAFMKSSSYKWQNEFRLSLEASDEDPFYLNIGDMHDIAIIYKTDKLIEDLEKAIITRPTA